MQASVQNSFCSETSLDHAPPGSVLCAGVEVAAELHDMVRWDLVKIYGNLIQDVHIRVWAVCLFAKIVDNMLRLQLYVKTRWCYAKLVRKHES